MSNEARNENAAGPPNTGTSLAFERTYLAHERTQMAWMRTALSLISFGFTIAKFFEFLEGKRVGAAPAMEPRTVGVLMIAIGLVALALSTLQHWRALRTLRARYPELPKSLSWVTATLLALLGLAALAGAMIRS